MADAAALAASGLLAEVRERLGAGASLQGIARQMNELGAKTPRGGAWTATAVKRALERVEKVAERGRPAADPSEVCSQIGGPKN